MNGTNGSNGKPHLKVLMFDNNGTMLDDLHLAYGSVEEIFKLLRLPSPSKDKFRSAGTNDVAEFCLRHGAPKSVTHEELDVVRKLYYNARLEQAHYRPDLKMTLDYCISKGLKLAVCSAEVDSVLRGFLERSNFADCFAVVKSEARPKAPALMEIVYQLSFRLDEAAYIDDSVDGMLAAKEAGVRTIAFAHPTSYALPQHLWAQKPDHVVNDFAELRRLISDLAA